MKIWGGCGRNTRRNCCDLNSEDFKLLKDETLELKHAAVEFAGLFPENSEAGNAKKIIWEERELFDEYNNNIINDINSMLADIENKNLSNLKISFISSEIFVDMPSLALNLSLSLSFPGFL